MNKIDCYVNEVLCNIVADENMKERIKSDLILQLSEAGQLEDIEDMLERMGEPRDVAKEAVYNLIKTAYPTLPDWIVNLFSSIEVSLGSYNN